MNINPQLSSERVTSCTGLTYDVLWRDPENTIVMTSRPTPSCVAGSPGPVTVVMHAWFYDGDEVAFDTDLDALTAAIPDKLRELRAAEAETGEPYGASARESCGTARSEIHDCW